MCAFGAAFTQACAYIATRKLHALPSMTILHYYSLFGIPFSAAMVLVFDIVRCSCLFVCTNSNSSLSVYLLTCLPPRCPCDR